MMIRSQLHEQTENKKNKQIFSPLSADATLLYLPAIHTTTLVLLGMQQYFLTQECQVKLGLALRQVIHCESFTKKMRTFILQTFKISRAFSLKVFLPLKQMDQGISSVVRDAVSLSPFHFQSQGLLFLKRGKCSFSLLRIQSQQEIQEVLFK